MQVADACVGHAASLAKKVEASHKGKMKAIGKLTPHQLQVEAAARGQSGLSFPTGSVCFDTSPLQPGDAALFCRISEQRQPGATGCIG